MAPTDGTSNDLSGLPQGLFRQGLREGVDAKLSARGGPDNYWREPSLMEPSSRQMLPRCSQKTGI